MEVVDALDDGRRAAGGCGMLGDRGRLLELHDRRGRRRLNCPWSLGKKHKMYGRRNWEFCWLSESEGGTNWTTLAAANSISPHFCFFRQL